MVEKESPTAGVKKMLKIRNVSVLNKFIHLFLFCTKNKNKNYTLVIKILTILRD